MVKLRNIMRTLNVMFVNRPVLLKLAWGNAIAAVALIVFVPNTDHGYWMYMLLAIADIAALITVERGSRNWER